MNSVRRNLYNDNSVLVYGVPLRLWHYDWRLRTADVELISDAIYIAIAWPEQ